MVPWSIKFMYPIWKAITVLNDIGQVSYNMKVGNGMYTKFWLDRWYTYNTLAFIYHQLFEICTNSTISVFQVIIFKGQALQFNRQIIRVVLIELNSIYQLIQQYTLTTELDVIVWR
jgi:hypothetical protein